MEIVRKVAEKLDLGVTFAESEWDGIFAGLDAKRWDMVANGVEITDERAEKYDFPIHMPSFIPRSSSDAIMTQYGHLRICGTKKQRIP